MIDVISPCVTFNDHEGVDQERYAYVKDHDDPVEERRAFVPFFEDIAVDYAPAQPRKCDARRVEAVSEEASKRNYDPTDKISARQRAARDARAAVSFATGHDLHRA